MTRLFALSLLQFFTSVLLGWTWAAGLLVLAAPFALAQVDQVVTEGEARAQEGKKAQDEIDTLSDQTGDLVAEYRQILKVIDGLKVYNQLLETQVANQQSEIDTLQQSLDEVAAIERQIVPLMVRMIDSLDTFVELDVPFLPEERQQRIAGLRSMMERSDVTTAEKFRRVMEAYQIENDYGRTIESYTGTLELDGVDREVNFLRIGRVALLYQTLDGERTGAWNEEEERWVELSPARYQRQVEEGLRIARKQLAPDMLVLPVPAPEEVAS